MAKAREPRAPVAAAKRDARFVFTGTIEQAGSSSLFFIPPGGPTAVVRVEHIHYAAPALRDQAGQRVTVVFAEGSEAASGKRVFYTNPILYGETIAVKEVRRSEAAEDTAKLHEKIVRMNNEAETEHLVSLLASAELVVHGEVVSTHQAAERDVARVSEHDPDWHVAMIRVVRTLKGEHKDEVAARFPKSRDIAWYRVPKPRDGQQGVFLLHRDGLEVGGVPLAILYPESLLPADGENVRRIAQLAGFGERR
jgi:hypothetical protein